MASRLEESTATAKKLLMGCAALVVVILLFTFISRLLKKEPPPYNPLPQVAEQDFGQLPVLEFESLQLANSSKPSYKIDTKDGYLPSFYPIVNVYKTKTPHQSLTAHDDAVATAVALGFTSAPQVISSTELKWTNGARTLKINKLYGSVEITCDYAKDPKAQNPHDIGPDYNLYINNAKRILENANIFPEGYEDGKSAITYLTLNPKKALKVASAASDADFIRIDFFKKAESLTPIIPSSYSEEARLAMKTDYTQYAYYTTSNPKQGQLYIILGGLAASLDIYELKFTDWKIASTSTYYLSSVTDAWEKIQSDIKYLRYLAKPNVDPYEPYTPLAVEEFRLTNVEIVYYTSYEFIDYIQPLYKFSGIALLEDTKENADFIFYYPSVKQE